MKANSDTQQRILDSARKLIYSRSYTDVGVADICEHAGVKKGSFYHFFPSKQELTLAMLDAFYLDMKEKLVSKAFAKDLPPMERLHRFGQLAYKFQKQIHTDTGLVLGCPFGNLSSEMATQDEQIRLRIEHIFNNLKVLLRDVIADAIAAGDMEKVNVEATAQAMLAYFEGILLMAKSQNNAELIKLLLPAMAQIRIHTL
jgi:TetR/AcrR family transcriptional repressor of nem operon